MIRNSSGFKPLWEDMPSYNLLLKALLEPPSNETDEVTNLSEVNKLKCTILNYELKLHYQKVLSAELHYNLEQFKKENLILSNKNIALVEELKRNTIDQQVKRVSAGASLFFAICLFSQFFLDQPIMDFWWAIAGLYVSLSFWAVGLLITKRIKKPKIVTHEEVYISSYEFINNGTR